MKDSSGGRLTRARSELQSAYTILKQIKPSSRFSGRFGLEVWRARSRLELAILLMKLSAGVDYEDRRPSYTLKAEPQVILENAKKLVVEALNDLRNISVALENVRKARDLLLLLEDGLRS